ncbi:MAG: dicarboxylate/amino acid:cation symporter [Planctomycetes bacterium]|nr:dicarboxylate/amino acid:cation symporter [Planctomycetota bacterium]
MRGPWKILIWLLAGALLGALLQSWHGMPPSSPLALEDAARVEGTTTAPGVRVAAAPARSRIAPGDVVHALVLERGLPTERRWPTPDVASYRAGIANARCGALVWHELARGALEPIALELDPRSSLATWIAPFAFVADLFLVLLKMLIVPIVLSSIIVGVIGVGTTASLKRLGLRTLAYYTATSALAIAIGLTLVNLIQPGRGAALGLPPSQRFAEVAQTSFAEVLLRIVPSNVFAALSDNASMLQVIFFALFFGICAMQVEAHHRETLQRFFTATFEVMMRLAGTLLRLIPYGIFCLLVKIVGTTGFAVFEPLAWYLVTVTAGILIHAAGVLPLLLRWIGRIRPAAYAKAVSPALVTAFSTSSSSLTLPVALEVVEKRGGVSNRVVSFVQPLGATVNMDGTALYECVGVIFLAQYYASIGGFELGLSTQLLVAYMALAASIGAAGIPYAGFVMMVMILSALRLPVEGAALLLVVDRPIDMLRTTTNIWSDCCGAAIIARFEGERPTGSI